MCKDTKLKTSNVNKKIKGVLKNNIYIILN